MDFTKLQALALALLGCGFIWLAFKTVTSKNSGDYKAQGGNLFTAICAIIIAGLGISIVTVAAAGPGILRAFGIAI